MVTDAISALVNLGYGQPQAAAAESLPPRQAAPSVFEHALHGRLLISHLPAATAGPPRALGGQVDADRAGCGPRPGSAALCA